MKLSRRQALGAAALVAATAGTVESAVGASRDTAPRASSIASRVHRGFIDLDYGQLHYRACLPTADTGAGGGAAMGTQGAGRSSATNAPLLMLHGFPSSSWALQPYLALLGRDRPTWAPDLPGMGDSAPHPNAQPSLEDLADSVLQAADALQLRRFDLYGTLTGARVAIEIGLRAPTRVRRLILDEPGGLPHDDPEFLTRYIPDLKPDALHAKTMEILKSAQLPVVFQSSVRYDVAARAPLLRIPTLTTDSLAARIPEARSLGLPRIEASNATEAQVAERVAAFRAFLDA